MQDLNDCTESILEELQVAYAQIFEDHYFIIKELAGM